MAALEHKAAMVLRNPPHLKHSPVYRYRRFLKPFFKQAGGLDPETLAVIRDPVSRLSSWYRYRHRDDLDGHPNSTKGVSFDEFVDAYCRGNRPPYADIGSQTRFLTDKDGNLGVDHLFQYEQMDKLIAFLEDRLEMSISLPQRNVSPKMDTPLSAKTLAKFERKHSEEFELWHQAQKA